jgi:hypothetical protein
MKIMNFEELDEYCDVEGRETCIKEAEGIINKTPETTAMTILPFGTGTFNNEPCYSC